ncbi:MAG: ribose 5-phosphate isomerase B [Candidatus Omnitrophota bacterium]
MKVAIGSDHGGYRLKTKISAFLKKRGHEVLDIGTHSPESCDYPPIGYQLARGVADGAWERGILICKTGIGFSIVANKVAGVRAALCTTALQARRSREHNDANVLCLAGSYLSARKAGAIVGKWLTTPFFAGRHARRVRQITNIEKKGHK